MAKRGSALREHVLWVAKDVFLELGFERTSMDVVSSRAQTSKRSLYAHFESKEKLFLAVVELVRGLLLGQLRRPQDHADAPGEALVLFCGRYLEILLYESSIRMCRLSMAETARFPEGAAQFFDVMFIEVERRLTAYVQTAFHVTSAVGEAAACRLLARILYPRLPRALFGMDALVAELHPDTVSPELDLAPVRAAVAELVAFLVSQQEIGKAATGETRRRAIAKDRVARVR